MSTKERELRQSSAAWEPEARLLGNVTAQEITDVCDAVTLLRAELETLKAVHQDAQAELVRLRERERQWLAAVVEANELFAKAKADQEDLRILLKECAATMGFEDTELYDPVMAALKK